MMKRFLVGAALLALGLTSAALAFEESALLLQFDPAKDTSSRYMFQLQMSGSHVSPGAKDELLPFEYMIGTVFKDTVVDSLPGQNRHRINFYTYNVRNVNFGWRDRNDPRFGPGSGGFTLPPDGGGDEGDGAGFSGSFVPNLGLPPVNGGGGGVKSGGGIPAPQPTQFDRGGGPGGGGSAGEGSGSVNLDTILVSQIDYITNKQGEVLDVGGLDLLRKVSQNQIVSETDDSSSTRTNYIDVNIGHVFEWTHMLYLPPYPVYKEDIWFHSMPVHVPGLPVDQPIMTKFMYKVVDFRTVGTRKVAVIDMSGVCEWNHEWETQSKLKLTEFKSWGNMGFSARYWFDYEKNVVFGIERPPFVDWQYMRFNPASPPGLGMQMPYDGFFAMQFPGLVISMDFFYNTRETDISGKPRLVEIQPKELRRHIVLNMVCQMEAE